MKRLWSFVFACVIAFGALGCTANKNSVYDECDVSIAYASGGGSKIYQMSLTCDKAGFDAGMELPIYRFDTLEDVE